jgi:protein-S-isoprenylcysteine O-methyltransferase Ste14
MTKHILTAAAILLALTLLFTFSAEFRELPWTPLRIAGLALAAPSFVLWFLARTQLGDSFSVRPEARKLVTHGLYSRIRNPIYLFGSGVIAGIFLFMNMPLALLLFAVLIPLQTIRARKEAIVLEEKFGQDYRDYKKKTWF